MRMGLHPVSLLMFSCFLWTEHCPAENICLHLIELSAAQGVSEEAGNKQRAAKNTGCDSRVKVG